MLRRLVARIEVRSHQISIAILPAGLLALLRGLSAVEHPTFTEIERRTSARKMLSRALRGVRPPNRCRSASMTDERREWPDARTGRMSSSLLAHARRKKRGKLGALPSLRSLVRIQVPQPLPRSLLGFIRRSRQSQGMPRGSARFQVDRLSRSDEAGTLIRTIQTHGLAEIAGDDAKVPHQPERGRHGRPSPIIRPNRP